MHYCIVVAMFYATMSVVLMSALKLRLVFLRMSSQVPLYIVEQFNCPLSSWQLLIVKSRRNAITFVLP